MTSQAQVTQLCEDNELAFFRADVGVLVHREAPFPRPPDDDRLAAASGVHLAIMQQLAGHSSAKTTMDTYAHVDMGSKRAAVMAMRDAPME